MMVNWSLCVEAYEPAIRVWTWWFRDGFGYFYDFWKLGLGMLPPFLCYQNAHTFHWSLFRSANHQESILQKRNHSNYPGCHEILSGSLQYWSSKFTQKLYRKVRFDYQKVILITYPKSICEATQRRSDIPAQWAQMGPAQMGPACPSKPLSLMDRRPAVAARSSAWWFQPVDFNPFRTEVWDHHPGVEHQCLKQSTKYHQILYRFI